MLSTLKKFSWNLICLVLKFVIYQKIPLRESSKYKIPRLCWEVMCIPYTHMFLVINLQCSELKWREKQIWRDPDWEHRERAAVSWFTCFCKQVKNYEMKEAVLVLWQLRALPEDLPQEGRKREKNLKRQFFILLFRKSDCDSIVLI